MIVRTTTMVYTCLVLLIWVTTGCIKAPNIVIRDQKTALEEQAAGRFPALENDLTKAVIHPKGEDFTSSQLERNKVDLATSNLGEITQLYSAFALDAEQIDDLLTRCCIGEAASGLVVKTAKTCTKKINTAKVNRLVERTNRHRRQLWRAIQKKRPQASLDVIRATWRKQHLKRVVCAGQIQTAAGSWEAKKC